MQTLIDIWITNSRVVYCYYILSISQLKTKILVPFVGFLIFVAKKEIFSAESDAKNLLGLACVNCLLSSLQTEEVIFPDIEIEG